MQAAFRHWQACRWQRRHEAALTIQRCYLGWAARHMRCTQHRAALLVQTSWKRHRLQAQFAQIRQAAIIIQVRKACYMALTPQKLSDTASLPSQLAASIYVMFHYSWTSRLCVILAKKRA